MEILLCLKNYTTVNREIRERDKRKNGNDMRYKLLKYKKYKIGLENTEKRRICNLTEI